MKDLRDLKDLTIPDGAEETPGAASRGWWPAARRRSTRAGTCRSRAPSQVSAQVTGHTLFPTPYTLHPEPYILHPQSSTVNPQPSTLNPQDSTLNPRSVSGSGGTQ